MITFSSALSGVLLGKEGPRTVQDCVQGLLLANDVGEALPTLKRLQRHLEGEYEGATRGTLIVGCLRAREPDVITVWVRAIAPEAWPSEPGPQSTKRAHRLYADCYLALDEWVTNWNRRQIKRVA